MKKTKKLKKKKLKKKKLPRKIKTMSDVEKFAGTTAGHKWAGFSF